MPTRFLFLLLIPLLVACTDQRVRYEINGRDHALTLVRVTTFPWEKTAEYAIIAARMPDCMRRHAMPKAPLNAKVEIFSPGNNAWIIRQNRRLFVTETRECEGFAPLDKNYSENLGEHVGTFEMRGETLVFTPAPKPTAAPDAAPAPAVEPTLWGRSGPGSPKTDSYREKPQVLKVDPAGFTTEK